MRTHRSPGAAASSLRPIRSPWLRASAWVAAFVAVIAIPAPVRSVSLRPAVFGPAAGARQATLPASVGRTAAFIPCPPGLNPCCEAAPQFTDVAYTAQFTGAIAVQTREPNPSMGNFSLEIYDLVHNIPAEDTNWPFAPGGRYYGPSNLWTGDNLGTVFGLTLDEYGNIFVTHGSCYISESSGQVPGAGPGAIYRIDAVTGQISVFARLPNYFDNSLGRYPALGNITYDCVHHQFFVSDLEDGRIYRLSSLAFQNGSPGKVLDWFDHGVADAGPTDYTVPTSPTPGFADRGERVWAVQWYNNRIYYGLWNQDAGGGANPNQVWSVGLTSSGGFDPPTDKVEITVPPLTSYSNPVSDISFSEDGLMYLAERGTNNGNSVVPHQARVLEYTCINESWTPSGNTYTVGNFSNHTNCSGGVDTDREVYDGPTGGAGSRGRIWVTGDALHLGGSYADIVYGLEALRPGGGGNTTSLLIDSDGNVSSTDKTFIGDVEIPCVSSGGQVASDSIHVIQADWLHDAFPFNETPGLPGTVAFDTCTALIKTGRNIAQLTGTTGRNDIPADTALIYAPGTPVRVDMIFRIKPGPGNYHTLGNVSSGLRVVPTNPVGIITPGSGTFFGQYMSDPGFFSTPGAVSLHSGAPSGWNPDVWNSARCDTAEINLFPVAGNPAPQLGMWAAMYHEGDPKFATLGITKNRCFLVNPNGPADCSNITCSSVPAWVNAATGWDGSQTTREYTKIIPDGILTPGSHVEYFFRKSSVATPATFTMIPDTTFVTPQPDEGSTDAHRWQQFGVLPDRWKAPFYGGDGLACMLYVDLDDSHGDEARWVSIADSIGATKATRRGAHNGWRARGDQHLTDIFGHPLHISTDPTIAVAAHGGQPGTSWDMYGVRGVTDPVNGFAGSLGSRLAPAPSVCANNKGARIGPTPEMLNLYPILFVLAGDLGDRMLGPVNDRGQNEITLLQNYLQGSTINRAAYFSGDDFVQSEILPALPAHLNFWSNVLGVDLRNADYATLACNPNPYASLTCAGPLPPNKFSVGLNASWGCDVLRIPIVGPVVSGNYEDPGFCPNGPYVSGVSYTPGAGLKYTSFVDGWDLKHLYNLALPTGPVNTRGSLAYLFYLCTTIQGSIGCPVQGTPGVTLGVDDWRTAHDVMDFLTVRNNPVRSGSAQLHFGVPARDRVQVRIFDVAGRSVRLLADRTFAPGEYDLSWDGLGDDGSILPRGVYFARVQPNGSRSPQARRIVLLR